MKNPSVVTQGIEFIEFAVKDLNEASKPYEKMGFHCVGYRNHPKRKSKLYMQGDIHMVLSASDDETDPAFQFARVHGDGALQVGYRVPNVEESYRIACSKGARPAFGPEVIEAKSGGLHQAGIHVYGDVRNVFVSYTGAGKFEDSFPENASPLNSHKGRLLQTIDHITVNVEKGEMDRWADFYQDVFGFHQVRYFDIRTERTGLLSRAIRNENGRVTMPFNEPTNSKSQIQEFVDTFHGPGIQHIAYHTSNIIGCLEELNTKGFKFLTVPDTYYEMIPNRVPNVTEDMNTLKRLGILVDGSDNGYLLQIFTENMVGPFFYEFIQRKGDNGFGDGNFRALFEAIERDQERRGVL
jgi:4-hydroxyphenylpyruvate dioxygenase